MKSKHGDLYKKSTSTPKKEINDDFQMSFSDFIDSSDALDVDENLTTANLASPQHRPDMEQFKQTSKSSKLSGNKSELDQRQYPIGSPKKRQLDEMVLKMITEDLQPFSIIDCSAFKNLVQTLDSKYKLPELPTLWYLLDLKYDRLKKKLIEELKSVEWVNRENFVI